MFGRKREGAVLCPGCGQLVGVNDERCLSCGRRRPGMFGFAAALRGAGDGFGFVELVMIACGTLYLATLVVDPSAIQGGSFLFLSPGVRSLYRFGASGAVPLFGYGRFWTPLSASWLHGGLLHIVFNMLAVRSLVPLTAHLYGTSRTIILYVVSGVTGFVASSVAGLLIPSMPFGLGGGAITVGASASVFGLIGALLYYARRGGISALDTAAKQWAIGNLLIGFVVPRIDNWAHLGGLAGGYLVGRWLDPLQPEKGDHAIAAGALLLLSLAAVVASVVTDLPAR